MTTITITETMNIDQAIGSLYDYSRQSLHINTHLETLIGDKKAYEREGEQIYDLVFQISSNLERMENMAKQLAEMPLMERTLPVEPEKPIAADSLFEIRGENYQVTALAKQLMDWLMEVPAGKDCGELEMNAGDYLEMAHLIVKASKRIDELTYKGSAI